MKSVFLVATLFLAGTLPAAADVRFFGTFVTTSVDDCDYTTVGDKRIASYRPPAVAGNPTSGGLSLTYPVPGGGFTIQFPGAHPALNVFQNVTAVEQGAFGFFSYATKIKFSLRTPVTTTTRFVTMRGTIEEPFGEKSAPGLCVVGFEAAFIRSE